MRDGFNPDDSGGEVRLDSNEREILDYPLSEQFFRAAKDSLDKMAQIQFAAGAKNVLAVHQQATLKSDYSSYREELNTLSLRPHQLAVFSAHVMGGNAMSDNPELGVTNNEGKLYGLDNLWVMDGSVLPTSLGVNPQLTLYGLVRRNVAKFLQQNG